IIEGVDERHRTGFCEILCIGKALFEAVALEKYPGTIPCRRFLLSRRDPDRHDDGCRDSGYTCGDSNSLRMVARGSRDHTHGTDRIFPGQDPVCGASDLEGSCLLHRLELEIHAGTCPL